VVRQLDIIPALAPSTSSSLADRDAGRAALERGAWREAEHAFTRAVAVEETPEALEGLALAAWWLDEAEVVFDARERAYRAYRSGGDAIAAARLAVWIAWDSVAFRGEQGVANGWLERARRLLEGQPDCPEHAWLASRAALFALVEDGDPDAAEALSGEAIRVGQAIRAIDHEMVGRALRAFARVTVGRVSEGLRELDEVSAAILAGEMNDRLLIGLAGCYLIAACERVRDHGRVTQWCDRIKEHSRKWGLKPLFAVCRTQYASVCVSRGAWDEAEQELTNACDELAVCRPGMTADGIARLGELRRRQGRLDEAALLFERSTTHPIASLGRAAMALDRGDARLAAELAERHLRRMPTKNRTERAPALEVLVRAQTQAGEGDLNRARTALDELRGIAADAQTLPLLASASLSSGLLALAGGDLDGARRDLEDAVDLFARSGVPFEMACARLDLARLMARLGRTDAAIVEADLALHEFTRLNALLGITSAQSLRAHLADTSSPVAAPIRPAAGLTAREMEVLRLISSGLANQAIAERLCISEHTVHRHVANTLSKLDVPSRSAAVAQAARLGLL
jgi:LuxR family transcriptional regulator, maltose regulon positive regulatory protein